MELRLVDRRFSRDLVFPFPNESQRIKGFAFVEGKTLIGFGEKDEHHVLAIPDDWLSVRKEEAGMCYLTVIDKETNRSITRAWDEKDYNAFIVNDNGKTIDKIVS